MITKSIHIITVMTYADGDMEICTDAAIKRASLGEFEAVAAMTYSGNATYTGDAGDDIRVRLGRFSEVSVDASAFFAEQTRLPIRIAGENSFGMHRPSTAELMKAKLKDWVDVDVIKNGSVNLINTGKQMQAHATQMRERGLLVVGYRFHLPRAIMHARAYGIKAVAGVAIEDILVYEEKSHHYPELKVINALADRERYIRQWARIDRRGRLLDILSGIQGPRLHDVEEVDGELVPLISTTRKHFRELTGRKPDF